MLRCIHSLICLDSSHLSRNVCTHKVLKEFKNFKHLSGQIVMFFFVSKSIRGKLHKHNPVNVPC